MDRRNFLAKTGMFTASSFFPKDIATAISPTELPIPNFDGLLNAANMFHGNFDFMATDSYTDIFGNIQGIYKFTDLQKKCFVLNPTYNFSNVEILARSLIGWHRLPRLQRITIYPWLLQNARRTPLELQDAQLKNLGIDLKDFDKVKSYWDKNAEMHNGWRNLSIEKWEEFQNLPEYKNCCVEIPFEKMARILGKDNCSSPLQFFAFNGSDQWHDYFDVFLESKGIEDFKNQTCKSLEIIKKNTPELNVFAEQDIKFLQIVKERLQSNQQVVTHCPEVIEQVNHLIKAIHVHVEDYKKISNSNLQKKHFNQSDQDPDWYNDKTDIFAATKERFHE